MTSKSKFVERVINYAKLHPGPESDFILQSYADVLKKKKYETKRWRLIADELLAIADPDRQVTTPLLLPRPIQ